MEQDSDSASVWYADEYAKLSVHPKRSDLLRIGVRANAIFGRKIATEGWRKFVDQKGFMVFAAVQRIQD